jgi:hypothetical protein
VVPEAGDKNFIDVDKQPLIRNLYDGYSRSRPAEVYGSVCNSCIHIEGFWRIGAGNVNAGAAALGGLAPGEPRAMSYEVVFIDSASGDNYHVDITTPGGGTVSFLHAVVLGETAGDVVNDLKTQILANAILAPNLGVGTTDSKLIIVAKKAGYQYDMSTVDPVQRAVVSTIKAGSGPGAAEPVLVSPGSGDPAITPGDGKGSSINTDPSDRVYVDFSVDPTWQTITFNAPVWFRGSNGGTQEPKLFLRTAVNVKNAATQQLVAYTDTQLLRPGPAVHVAKRPDVQLNVIGEYKIVKNKLPGGPGGVQYSWQLKNTKLLEADAVLRARYYLIAELLQFQLKGGLTVFYNGIEPIRMDGKTQQVTYRVQGGQGTSTTASTNMEHSTWLPPYPARRRQENLGAVMRARPGGRVDNPGNPGNPGSQNPGPG